MKEETLVDIASYLKLHRLDVNTDLIYENAKLIVKIKCCDNPQLSADFLAGKDSVLCTWIKQYTIYSAQCEVVLNEKPKGEKMMTSHYTNKGSYVDFDTQMNIWCEEADAATKLKNTQITHLMDLLNEYYDKTKALMPQE